MTKEEIKSIMINYLKENGSINEYKTNMINRYINFVVSYNLGDSKYERHHILPGSLFPEYKNFKDNEWNCIKLSYRAHVLVHIMLHYIFGGKMTYALTYMLKSDLSIGSKNRLYDKIQKEKYKSKEYKEACKKGAYSVSQSNIGKIWCNDGNKNYRKFKEEIELLNYSYGKISEYKKYERDIETVIGRVNCITCCSSELGIESHIVERVIRYKNIEYDKNVGCSHGIILNKGDIEKVLYNCNGNIVESAKRLEISFIVLARYMKESGMIKFDYMSNKDRFKNDDVFFNEHKDKSIEELKVFLNTNMNSIRPAFKKRGLDI